MDSPIDKKETPNSDSNGTIQIVSKLNRREKVIRLHSLGLLPKMAYKTDAWVDKMYSKYFNKDFTQCTKCLGSNTKESISYKYTGFCKDCGCCFE